MKMFEKHFNYEKSNGMLASKFIFNNIIQEINKVSSI